jgi:hypothetical protein
MLFRKAGKPNNFKKTVYLLAATILGVLLSLMAHAIIEINYLSWAERHGVIISFYGACALPPIAQSALWALGAVGGFCLGRFWWRIIYIERVWEKNGRK